MKSTNSETTTLVNKLAPFVTAEEITRANELEKELKRLNRQHLSVHATDLQTKCDVACAAYVESPTDANLHAFRQAAIDLALTERHIISPVVEQTVDAIRRACEANIRAWARPLLERGLAAARAALDVVTASERARHKDLTGEENLRDNPVIAAARTPVSQLEALLTVKTTSAMPALQFLRAHEVADA
jgi:hypothetical protein